MSRDKPNILLITTDTQRCDTLRCMGNPHAVSPNLDRLAQEGTLFENAHTSSPVCMPARCSLMTGCHAHVHGCIENGFRRHTHLPVITDLLEEQGYRNIMVGKTHFGPMPESFHVRDTVQGGKGSDANDGYGRFIREKGYSRSSTHPNPVPDDLFIDAYLATSTIEEMRKVAAEDEQPFFAFCSMPSPHSPLDPPGKWATLYDELPLPDVNYREGEYSELPDQLKMFYGEENGFPYDPESLDAMRRLYYGLTAYCDHQVGRMLHFLDESGLRERTLVLFTSDHGLQYMDHGFINKHTWYDESWRVPFIMSMPGTLPAGERRQFAIWNDISTTILAAAGTQCPTMQGFDLFGPLCRGENSPRKCAVGSLFKSAAVASERWKLEYYFEEARGRLFNRLDDPKEQTDLFHADALRDVRDKLLTGLLAWYGDCLDLKAAQDRIGGGGPVAKRVTTYAATLNGLDPEKRLNTVCEGVESTP